MFACSLPFAHIYAELRDDLGPHLQVRLRDQDICSLRWWQYLGEAPSPACPLGDRHNSNTCNNLQDFYYNNKINNFLHSLSHGCACPCLSHTTHFRELENLQICKGAFHWIGYSQCNFPKFQAKTCHITCPLRTWNWRRWGLTTTLSPKPSSQAINCKLNLSPLHLPMLIWNLLLCHSSQKPAFVPRG